MQIVRLCSMDNLGSHSVHIGNWNENKLWILTTCKGGLISRIFLICSYSPSKVKVKDRDFAQFFLEKIPSEVEPLLTVLITRGVKSSGDMYITSLNPNTFSYLKWTKPIHMLCLISYKTSQHEFCDNEKIIVFAQRHFCSTQLEITNAKYVESRFLYNFWFHPKDLHSMIFFFFFELFKSPSRSQLCK